MEDKWLKSCVIYAIPCTGHGTLVCVWYVGQTIQYLKERIKDHRKDVNLYEAAKRNNNFEEMENLAKKSVIVNYIHENSQNLILITPLFLYRHHKYKLNYLEMFMIQNNYTCNKTTDVKNLSLAYHMWEILTFFCRNSITFDRDVRF
jgi:hypothetical protein